MPNLANTFMFQYVHETVERTPSFSTFRGAYNSGLSFYWYIFFGHRKPFANSTHSCLITSAQFKVRQILIISKTKLDKRHATKPRSTFVDQVTFDLSSMTAASSLVEMRGIEVIWHMRQPH